MARQAYIKDHRTTLQMQRYGFREHAGHRCFVFQTLDMRDDGYEVAMYFVRKVGVNHPFAVTAGRSRYYFLHVDELIGLFNEAGLEEVHRLDGVVYQPPVVGEAQTYENPH